MNWKKVITIAALTGFSASVATGQGTAPTIVQGDYITNVFGNSNFIKNPNAKLNTKDVTVSNATVSRSTTTPLVATSEFTITTSTATGYADWSLRAFDQGMKGQNCEARFTYRGFSVGSTTAQILQGANVVAQLALTPSTDPRIASINFPCGDLSAVTKFRLQQASASLTGTNEISGIYTGLATNMANVAQAEMVGGLTTSSLLSRVQGAANVWTDLTNVTGTVAAVGQATSASNTMSVTFANLPAGEYQVIMNQPFFIYGGSGGHSCRLAILETTSGARQLIEQSGSNAAPATQYVSIQAQTTARFAFMTSGSRTFKVQVNNNGWLQSTNGECYSESAYNGGIFVYRFPSSSELVVTPERQNVFGAVQWPQSATGYAKAISGTSSATPVNQTTFASSNATYYGGGQAVATANDYGLKVSNIPPGTYRVTAVFNVQNNTGSFDCEGQIWDGSTVVAASGSDVQNSFLRQGISNLSGVVRYTSFQSSREFTVRVKPTSNTITCTAMQMNGAQIIPSIVFEPLDQPSNSALYVEGPVKAAATGATIPSGYQSETQSSQGGFTVYTSNTPTTMTSLTLQPGVYMLIGQSIFGNNNLTGATGSIMAIGTTTNSFTGTTQGLSRLDGVAFQAMTLVHYVTVTSATTYYLVVQTTATSGNAQNIWGLRSIRLN